MGAAVLLCFSNVVWSFLLCPQHSTSRLCENRAGNNRCVSLFLSWLKSYTIIIIVSSVNYIICFWVWFLTEPKDDLAYAFIKSWIGKTALPPHIFCLISYLIFTSLLIAVLFVKLLFSLTHILSVSVFREWLIGVTRSEVVSTQKALDPGFPFWCFETIRETDVGFC